MIESPGNLMKDDTADNLEWHLKVTQVLKTPALKTVLIASPCNQSLHQALTHVITISVILQIISM